MTQPIHVVSAALLYPRGDNYRLLLQLREGGDYADLWETPGGKVEPGESTGLALRRELDEELGLTSAQVNLFHTHEAYRTFDSYGECIYWNDEVKLPSKTIRFSLNLLYLYDDRKQKPFPHVAKAIGLFTPEDCQRLLEAQALTPCTALAMPEILKRMR